jgi:hypothetical protein
MIHTAERQFAEERMRSMTKQILHTLVAVSVSALLTHTLPAQQPPQSAAAPAVATPPARASFHIYLLMGQSNMVGRDIRSLASQVDNPRVLSLNHDNQWLIAREPIHYDTQKPAGRGPGIPFAVEMLKPLQNADSNATIGLVPCAVGGTPLSRWVKGADLYEVCMVRAKIAAQAGIITGMIWHQGEADTTDKQLADTYASRLTQMFTDLRADLNQPDLPIVVGQLGPFLDSAKYPFLDTVKSAIEHMPAALPHIGYADSAGLEDRGDQLHFSADSQKIFGARYARAMQGLATNP